MPLCNAIVLRRGFSICSAKSCVLPGYFTKGLPRPSYLTASTPVHTNYQVTTPTCRVTTTQSYQHALRYLSTDSGRLPHTCGEFVTLPHRAFHDFHLLRSWNWVYSAHGSTNNQHPPGFSFSGVLLPSKMPNRTVSKDSQGHTSSTFRNTE